ncbi:SDR family oxidoreductase [Aquipuribacter sp. SD81]|uniref:SDR family oxidoreductase n=1 Tax=Aquipuribacter sp. SD81 TaxID=3127703 RepID=UPI003017BA94
MPARPSPTDHRGPPGGGAGTGGTGRDGTTPSAAGPARGTPRRPLDGDRALVVGGERGLGRHVVAALARAGADVAVAYDLDRPDAHDDAREAEDLVTRSGRAGLLLPADLTDHARCHQLVGDTVEHLGGLDVLVHVVTPEETASGAAVRDVEPAAWRRTWALLVDSLVHTTTAALDPLAGGGRLLTTARPPAGARSGEPLGPRVAAAAVEELSRALAEQLAGTGTRVVCVVPAPGADVDLVAEGYVRLAAPGEGPAPAGPVVVGRPAPS